MSKKPTLAAVIEECHHFPTQFQSVQLATCNPAGEPESSYAAYVSHNGNYYVYTSDLSQHTANLISTKRCSMMFIESEEQAKHLFARRRLTLSCEVVEQPRDTPQFDAIMDRFVLKFGNFMGMLRQLHDFHLFELRPTKGAYVAGFAQAYVLEGQGLSTVRHRQEQGHHSADYKTQAALEEMTP